MNDEFILDKNISIETISFDLDKRTVLINGSIQLIFSQLYHFSIVLLIAEEQKKSNGKISIEIIEYIVLHKAYIDEDEGEKHNTNFKSFTNAWCGEDGKFAGKHENNEWFEVRINEKLVGRKTNKTDSKDYEDEEEGIDDENRRKFLKKLFSYEKEKGKEKGKRKYFWLGELGKTVIDEESIERVERVLTKLSTTKIEFPKENEKSISSLLSKISEQIEDFNKQALSLKIHPDNQPWSLTLYPNPNFTGREEAMEQLRQLLLQEKQTFITHIKEISGMGGIGKTQLAVEYAWKYKEEYHGGVLWVKCAQKIISKFGSLVFPLHLDIPFDIDDNARCQCVKYYLQEINEDSLLILDGLDNKDDFKIIRDFFPAIGNCHILVTSRLKKFSQSRIELDVFSDDEALKLLYGLSTAVSF